MVSGIEIGQRPRWPLDGFGCWGVPSRNFCLGGEEGWVEKRGESELRNRCKDVS